MARRGPTRRKNPSRARRAPRQLRRPAPWWQWVLGLVVISGFAYFLYWLSTDTPSSPVAKPRPPVAAKSPSEKAQKPKEEPRFTFYTILPEKEVIVPEAEVKVRKRQERLGQRLRGRYFIQAGSFHTHGDADRLKARLALLGVEARIEKAKVKGILWHRVRMGPFSSMNEVESIRSRLRKHHIDSVVQTASR